jgi:hypothetical protein
MRNFILVIIAILFFSTLMDSCKETSTGRNAEEEELYLYCEATNLLCERELDLALELLDSIEDSNHSYDFVKFYKAWAYEKKGDSMNSWACYLKAREQQRAILHGHNLMYLNIYDAYTTYGLEGREAFRKQIDSLCSEYKNILGYYEYIRRCAEEETFSINDAFPRFQRLYY